MISLVFGLIYFLDLGGFHLHYLPIWYRWELSLALGMSLEWGEKEDMKFLYTVNVPIILKFICFFINDVLDLAIHI